MDDDEKALYATPEGLLNGLRQRQREVTSGNQSVKQSIWRPVQSYPSYAGTDNDTGYDATQPISRGNGSISSGTSGNDSDSGSTSDNEGRASGRSGILNQLSGTIGRTANEPELSSSRSNWQQNLKTAVAPIQEIWKQGRKEQPKGKKSTTGKILSDAEAIKYREKLVEFVLWTSDNMDKILQAVTKGHEPVEIWQTITNDEAEILVDMLVKRAKANSQIAGVVREMVVFMDQLRSVLIIGTRTYASALLLWQRGISIY